MLPLANCDALTGTWSNHGNLIRDESVDRSVLAAVLGLADTLPESAFAETVRLERQHDGALLIEARDASGHTQIHTLPAHDIVCGASGALDLRLNGRRRVAIDAAGALWVGEHRFPQPGAARCDAVGHWTHSAPDGMATIVRGSGALPLDPNDPANAILVGSTALSMGVKVPATSLHLLPHNQTVVVRVQLHPSSRWQFNPPQVAIEVSRQLEACHTYLLVGGSDPDDSTVGDSAWAALVDMGMGFDWWGCKLAEPARRMSIEGDEIVLAPYCLKGSATTSRIAIERRADRG
ncbi:MAG: hypothetical protein HC809_05550 [Gammaproteobacteria bacterium]|nr:hypothetical protein [Gammaproteobacteria bacterium]